MIRNIKTRTISFLKKIFFGGRLRRIRVGGFEIYANWDHMLPVYLRNRPSYASNLPRIVAAITKKYSDAALVDIGANIGDTVALVRTKVSCPIVCIEGDDVYFNILKKNMSQFKEVSLLKVFLGDKEGKINLGETRDGGTAALVAQDTNGAIDTSVQIQTLNDVARGNPDIFRKVRLIKIDTDGYDLKIIRGAFDFLKAHSLPALFFEFDRFFISRASDRNGTDIFKELSLSGYTKALFFDNSGRFILSTQTSDIDTISQLYAYTYKKRGAFPFYDVCVVSSQDEDVAHEIIRNELEINNENTF